MTEEPTQPDAVAKTAETTYSAGVESAKPGSNTKKRSRWTREEALEANKKAVLSPRIGKHGKSLVAIAEKGLYNAAKYCQKVLKDPESGRSAKLTAASILAKVGARRVPDLQDVAVSTPAQDAALQQIVDQTMALDPAHARRLALAFGGQHGVPLALLPGSASVSQAEEGEEGKTLVYEAIRVKGEDEEADEG